MFVMNMKKIISCIYAIMCLIAVSSCVTGRYIVSYGNFAPPHDVVWDWKTDPPLFSVNLKSHIRDIGGASPGSYEFSVTASGGGVIPYETIAGGFPRVNTDGSYWRWVDTVYVLLAEMPRDTDFPIKLQIIRGEKVIETFNVKLK
jgi:hypothetical protein